MSQNASGGSPWADRSVALLNVAPHFVTQIAQRFRIHRCEEAFDPETEALISQFAPVNGALIAKYPKLRLVATTMAGYDAIDTKALQERGILLSTRQSIPDPCVSDLALGLLIAALRRIPAAERFTRNGNWPGGRFTMTRRVSGRRMGIYGMGRIGKGIAQRAAAFDMEIGYHNRTAKADSPYRYFPTLLEMAEWCDYLVVACPLSEATRHKVDGKVIAAVGPEGCIVNIARGPIIDEPALVEALEKGLLGSAGLDVFEDEPRVPERLFALDNVVLTPHQGGVTPENHRDAIATAIDNVETFFRTGRPLIAINLDE